MQAFWQCTHRATHTHTPTRTNTNKRQKPETQNLKRCNLDCKQVMTYKELRAKVASCAAALQADGVGQGDVCAGCLISSHACLCHWVSSIFPCLSLSFRCNCPRPRLRLPTPSMSLCLSDRLSPSAPNPNPEGLNPAP